MSYRYTLRRLVGLGADSTRHTLLWVMLNPSTADESLDDPTIRKCKGFTSRWGYRSMLVVNLFAVRATKPSALWAAEARGADIIGPENDISIIEACRQSDAICVAWGALPRKAHARRRAVQGLLWRHHPRAHSVDHKLWQIASTRHGDPRHPLMAAYTDAPVIWHGVTP